jgi:TonB family protein
MTTDAVSDILRSRMQEPGGLTPMAAVSVAAHAVALVAIVLLPGVFPAKRVTPPAVMTISLGGTPGPKTGGITTIGGRRIEAGQLTTTPKVERMAMPTVRAQPAMVLPIPDPKLKPATAPKPAPTAKDVAGRGRGFDEQKGSTSVETGARGMGFGLSNTGGGGMGGHLDVANFCCPEYLTEMVARIKSNWVQQAESSGTVWMKFTILRNGQITQIETERSSNIFALDQASQRALYLTTRLQPLPAAFPDDLLTVHVSFEYQRKP